MTDRELMQQALDALDIFYDEYGWGEKQQKAHEALRARLAQPEEPDWSAAGFSKPPTHSEAWWKHEVSNAWAEGYEKGRSQREWQGLTEAERIDIVDEEIAAQNTEHFALAQAIEAKLKEKNT